MRPFVPYSRGFKGFFKPIKKNLISQWCNLLIGVLGTEEGRGRGQILERRNVERPIFRNFKIANIKVRKDELFDSSFFEFNFSYFRNPLNTQNI